MARQLLRNIDFAISKLPETAVNTPYILETDFKRFRCDAIPPQIPQLEFTDDAEEVGDGNEFADNLYPQYWQQVEMAVSGKLNTEIALILWLRALGGAVTDAQVGATVAYDHSAPMMPKSAGITPKLSTIIMRLGGAYFLFSSLAVNSYQVSQEAAEEPRFTANLIGTGFFKNVAVDMPTFNYNTIEAIETYNRLHGAALEFTYNDGGTVNLPADGRLTMLETELNNNISIVRLPGDPFQTAGDYSTGAIARVIENGVRTASLRAKAFLDENLTEWTKMKSGTVITNARAVWNGAKVGATVNDHEFEQNVPKSRIRSVTSDQQDDKGAIMMDFFPLPDTVSGGLVTGRGRNAQLTMV